MISNKYGKSNNHYLSDYDSSKPSKYITYLDANNLHGWAMSRPLPNGGFDWLTDDQINSLDVMNIPENSDIGYMLEVDLKYPTELHDSHSDYPLAPESVAVNDDMISPSTRELKKTLGN